MILCVVHLFPNMNNLLTSILILTHFSSHCLLRNNGVFNLAFDVLVYIMEMMQASIVPSFSMITTAVLLNLEVMSLTHCLF